MLDFRGLCVVVLALAAAPAFAAGRTGPSVMEGRWKSDVIVLDLVTCGKGYCGQLVLPSGCGETALRLVATKASGVGIELEGSIFVPAENHAYKAYALFEKDQEDAANLIVDGYDVPPSYEHREFPFEAPFFRAGAATCRAVSASQPR